MTRSDYITLWICMLLFLIFRVWIKTCAWLHASFFQPNFFLSNLLVIISIKLFSFLLWILTFELSLLISVIRLVFLFFLKLSCLYYWMLLSFSLFFFFFFIWLILKICKYIVIFCHILRCCIFDLILSLNDILNIIYLKILYLKILRFLPFLIFLLILIYVKNLSHCKRICLIDRLIAVFLLNT
jgi:hypothetical protein